MRHGVHASNQSLSDVQPIDFLLENEGVRQLGLELLKVVVPIVSHLIADSNDHQLEFVDLADGLWCRGLWHDWRLGSHIIGTWGFLVFLHNTIVLL